MILSNGASRAADKERGFTMLELMVVCVILMILAAIAMPVTKFAMKRSKEAELRGHLREMRNAIDEFKRYSDAGLLPIEFGTEGYPSELEILVKGIDVVGQVDRQKKFLRRLPVDPMTGESEWGLRSYRDEWDAMSWGGDNVYDVYSRSNATALDGTHYNEW